MDSGSNGRIWGMARRIPGTSYGRAGRGSLSFPLLTIARIDVRRTPGSGDIFLPCSGAVIKKSLKRRAETWKTKPNSCSSATRITTGS